MQRTDAINRDDGQFLRRHRPACAISTVIVPHPKQDPLVVVARAAPWICAAALVATGLMVVYSPSSSFSRPLVSFTKPLVDVCVNTMKPHSHILGTVWTGLATGCLHTLTGPDHLAALAPLTIGRSRAMSAVLGALWGGGHGTGQMLLGLVFLLFKDRISHMLPMLSRWSGTLVGLTLVAIGAVGVLEAKHLEKEAPKADGASTDMEGVDMEVVEAVSKSKHIGLATYANGIVFGLQPDALMVVLPALALPSKLSIAAFLTTFMLGTMLAMGSYTAFIGAASHALGKRMPWVTQRLSLIAGIIAITFGGAFIASNVFAVGPLACA
eukprot:jgi/Mesvir1/12290/Mv00495-RA.1